MAWGDGFEIETVLNIRFFLAGHRIVEVPSVEKNRIYGESNLHAVSDGLRVLRTILAERAHARATTARAGIRRRRSHALSEPIAGEPRKVA